MGSDLLTRDEPQNMLTDQGLREGGAREAQRGWVTGLRPLEELVAQLDPCSHPYYDCSLSSCRVGPPRWVPRVGAGLGVSLNHRQGSHTHAGPQPASPSLPGYNTFPDHVPAEGRCGAGEVMPAFARSRGQSPELGGGWRPPPPACILLWWLLSHHQTLSPRSQQDRGACRFSTLERGQSHAHRVLV